jgi:PAS domain S-box-containing protein
MNLKRQKLPAYWPFIFAFVFILIIILLIGYFYNKYQKDRITQEKQFELSAIVDLKARQIDSWRKEHIGNGNIIFDNLSIIRQLNGCINYCPENQKKEMLKWMTSLTVNFDYTGVFLLDNSLNVTLSVPVNDTLYGDQVISFLPELTGGHKVILTDLHKSEGTNFIHLDLIIPLISVSESDTTAVGFLLLKIDPEKMLFPLVQSWPIPSKTSETLLLKIENDSVLFLNNLRHQDNTALRLRLPVSDSFLPSDMLAKGSEGTINGFDYRDIAVIAAMKKIPNSPWLLVAKTDREELFTGLNNEKLLVKIIIALFILTIGSIIGSLWRNHKARFYREKYESELDRMALIKHFDFILKYANDIILLIDKDLKIVEANDRALEAYLYKRDELIGMKIMKLRSKESVAQLVEQIKIIDEKESATFETIHQRKDKTPFPIEISARVVSIEGTKYYQTIGRDITERKLVENTLRESEEKFRKIFEESPLCMVMTDKDFSIIRANHSFCKMIGFQEDEILDYTFRNFTHPDYINGDEISLMKLITEEIPIYKTEKRYIRKDKSVIWGSTTVSIIHNDRAEVQNFLAMVEDITSRKEAEAELEKSFSLLKATLESTADGILVVDASGKIVQFNQKFAEMWKIPVNILASGEDNDVLKLVREQLINPARFSENVRHMYSIPEAIISDLLEFKDGRFFEWYSQPQKINGKGVGRVWSFRDITKRKRAEADLIAAKEKAEESDKLKTAFLHNVSHEIRTPMNAIMGFSSLLNELGKDEPETRQYTDIISQSGDHLLSIINDIVDVANIESGQTRLNIKATNLNSSLRSLNEQFSYKEKLMDVNIYLKMPLSEENAKILTDSTKLIQILSNLINNAIKFTNNGQIDFGYVRKNNYLEFYVKDTGIGISPEHQSRIFDRFYQIDSTESRKFGGTGLGLSICKAYVELMGGKIWLNSQQGTGSQFFFTIPYRRHSGN